MFCSNELKWIKNFHLFQSIFVCWAHDRKKIKRRVSLIIDCSFILLILYHATLNKNSPRKLRSVSPEVRVSSHGTKINSGTESITA